MTNCSGLRGAVKSARKNSVSSDPDSEGTPSVRRVSFSFEPDTEEANEMSVLTSDCVGWTESAASGRHETVATALLGDDAVTLTGDAPKLASNADELVDHEALHAERCSGRRRTRRCVTISNGEGLAQSLGLLGGAGRATQAAACAGEDPGNEDDLAEHEKLHMERCSGRRRTRRCATISSGDCLSQTLGLTGGAAATPDADYCASEEPGSLEEPAEDEKPHIEACSGRRRAKRCATISSGECLAKALGLKGDAAAGLGGDCAGEDPGNMDELAEHEVLHAERCSGRRRTKRCATISSGECLAHMLGLKNAAAALGDAEDALGATFQ